MKNIKFKIIVSLAFFFLFAPSTFASTCGVTSTGGNWNAAATWFDCAGGIPIAGDAVLATSTSGNLAINANTAALKSIDFTGYTGTLSGAFQLIIRGLAASTQVVTFSAGMTVSWSGILNIQPVATTAEIDITTNGQTIGSYNSSAGSAGTVKLMDNLTFKSSSINSASLTWGLTGTFNMNGFTISGASATDRILISSGSSGSRKTLTLNGGSFANADFQDIGFNNGGVSLDLSAITGLSGDGGNNVMIGGGTLTMTTATTTYWVGDSGFWSQTAHWSSTSGGSGSTIRVPLPQDDVVFDSNSFSGTGFTVTANEPRAGHNVSFALVGTDNPTLTVTANQLFTVYGSLYLDNGMTFSNITGVTLDFRGQAGSYNIDMQGVSIPRPITFNAYQGVFTLLNDMTTVNSVSIVAGTLTANVYNVTMNSLSMANSSGAIINMGSGTWTVTTTGAAWSIGTSAVVNPGTSTIVMSNSTAAAKTFQGTSHTFYNVSFTGNNITVTGSNTFNNLGVDNAGDALTNGLILTTGVSTTTITSISTNATTTADRGVIQSTTAGTIAGLQANTGGNVCVDFLSIKDIRAYGTSSFYAGANSLDVSGNIGWSFTACPTVSTPARSSRTLFQRIKMIISGRRMIIR